MSDVKLLTEQKFYSLMERISEQPSVTDSVRLTVKNHNQQPENKKDGDRPSPSIIFQSDRSDAAPVRILLSVLVYRAGERLYSEYYGEYGDYTRNGLAE